MAYTNLIHLCEPAFEYICKVNRIARNGGQMDYHQLRADILDILEEIEKEAARDARLSQLYEQVKMPLIFFIDSTIVRSGINCAEDWEENRIAFDHGHLSGDEDFFDMMEEMEADPSDNASECLAIFFTCVGLGFTGFYEDKTDFLKKKMDKISTRIRKYIESDPNARIAPECYEHTDRSDLVEPPGSKLLGILIAFAGLFIVVFISILILFDQAVGDLNRSVNTVVSQDLYSEEL
jgi:type VI protein secretion system component VasF